MRVAPRVYIYLMPRVAKICEILGPGFLSIGMVSAAVFYCVSNEQNREDRCKVAIGIGSMGAVCVIARDMLRYYRKMPGFFVPLKYCQLALLVIAVVAVCFKRYGGWYVAAGCVGLGVGSHCVCKITSRML